MFFFLFYFIFDTIYFLVKMHPVNYLNNEFLICFDRFIQQKLGGPSLSEYEKLQAEMSELQNKYGDLLGAHQETCKEVRLLCYIQAF